MGSGNVINLHKITRFAHEIEECGGDPKLLFDKLDSNLKLTEQNEHLEGTLQGIKARTAKSLEEEREALSRRDDALQAQKNAEGQLTATREKLAVMLETEPEEEKIMEALDQARNNLVKAKEEAAIIERYVAPGRWLLGLLFGFPDLLRRHREVLDQPPPPQEYTEEIGRLIIQLAIREVQRHGDLVPKSKYIEASLAADNYKRRQDMVLDLLQNPAQSTPEQRQALLGLLIDLGLTPENYSQFKSQFSIPWRKCPFHKEVDLKPSTRTLKFECTHPGCAYTE